jgi:hypothetical protein
MGPRLALRADSFWDGLSRGLIQKLNVIAKHGETGFQLVVCLGPLTLCTAEDR